MRRGKGRLVSRRRVSIMEDDWLGHSRCDQPWRSHRADEEFDEVPRGARRVVSYVCRVKGDNHESYNNRAFNTFTLTVHSRSSANTGTKGSGIVLPAIRGRTVCCPPCSNTRQSRKWRNTGPSANNPPSRPYFFSPGRPSSERWGCPGSQVEEVSRTFAGGGR